MTPAERIENLELTIEGIQYQIDLWRQVQEAKDNEKSPHRDLVVVKVGGEYIATHRYEVNEVNGFVTVQLKDGSILPTRLGHWALWPNAEDILGIERREIKIDNPQPT